MKVKYIPIKPKELPKKLPKSRQKSVQKMPGNHQWIVHVFILLTKIFFKNGPKMAPKVPKK